MSVPDIQLYDDPVPAFADALMEAAASGGHVVLTGGSTPKAAYELAARHPQSFGGARLWFGDERCVAPEDERSNYGMVRQALLEPLQAAGGAIEFCRRMEGELGPDAGAESYSQQLDLLGGGPGLIEFELIVLGIGPDAHIASMFPGQPSLGEKSRLVVGVPEAGHEPFVPRISFTFPALARARRIIVLATGDSKADAISRAFAEDAAPTPEVPASLLAEHAQSLTVMLDHAAAARL